MHTAGAPMVFTPPPDLAGAEEQEAAGHAMVTG